MADQQNLDLNLYSRQLYVLGLETMLTLGRTNVLVSGMKGLGVEVAKNIILAGPKSVTVHDDENTEIADLSSQFYLTEADVGKNRAEACVTKLSELNPYVTVKATTGELTEESLKAYQVVVFTNNRSLSRLQKLADFCHSQSPPIAVVIADTRGLFSNIFIDFGPEFTVNDVDGEEYPSHIITNITNGNPAGVNVHDEARISFESGDSVTFEDITGMDELNGKTFTVKVNGPYTFTIEGLDATGFKPYVNGGLVRKAKTPKKIHFLSYSEALKKPEFVLVDFAKFDRPPNLHLGFQALLKYQEAHDGKLPEPGNEEQALEVLSIAKGINAESENKLEQPEEDVIKKLALYSRGDINPMNAFLGGIVAQEALKISGKFGPINQFFYFDAIEALPSTLSAEDIKPTGSRYDNNVAVWGREIQNIFANLNLFLVGAGALGCELLKNFALMGIATQDGLVQLTDMDTIEKSNLNRQFLFRDKDIGKMKSHTAAAAVKGMNPNIKVQSTEIPVGPTTESTFHEKFWQSLDVAVNALDNVTARLYVDSQCVNYKKPLLESGTLGTKANTQVVIPYQTESYGSSADPPEKEIPICTLKNFPHAIEHTIQWARDLFEGLFTSGAQDVNKYLEDPDYINNLLTSKNQHVNEKRATLEVIHSVLGKVGKLNFESCVEEARQLFEVQFANKIKQLLFNFPLDHTDEHGIPFWSGPKRPPTPAVFDVENPTHLSFIVTTANLLAYIYNLPEQQRSTDPEYFRKVLAGIKVPVFEPKKGVKIQANEKEKVNEGGEDDDEVVERLAKTVPDRTSFAGFRMSPAHFEKDDDTNFHIDFITATSNLRAANYSIKEADRNTTKRIAGRIIPAIATTTSMVTGLVCLELLKLVQKKPLDQFKNSFVNLALPLFAFSEPLPPPKHTSDPKAVPPRKAHPEGWTLWDTIDIDEGDITVQELVDYFKNKLGFTITSIATGRSLLYSTFMPAHQARLVKKVSVVWQEVTKKELGAHQEFIEVVAEVEGEEIEELGLETEVDLPTVRIKFRSL